MNFILSRSSQFVSRETLRFFQRSYATKKTLKTVPALLYKYSGHSYLGKTVIHNELYLPTKKKVILKGDHFIDIPNRYGVVPVKKLQYGHVLQQQRESYQETIYEQLGGERTLQLLKRAQVPSSAVNRLEKLQRQKKILVRQQKRVEAHLKAVSKHIDKVCDQIWDPLNKS